MAYAVGAVQDLGTGSQTIVYWTNDGWTPQLRNAAIFDSERDAKETMYEVGGDFLEIVSRH